MSRRKARPKQENRTHGPASIGTCRTCGKQIWKTRKDAKNASRMKFPASGQSGYPCPAGNGYHFGHLAPQAKAGDVDRRDLRQRPPGGP